MSAVRNLHPGEMQAYMHKGEKVNHPCFRKYKVAMMLKALVTETVCISRAARVQRLLMHQPVIIRLFITQHYNIHSIYFNLLTDKLPG